MHGVLKLGEEGVVHTLSGLEGVGWAQVLCVAVVSGEVRVAFCMGFFLKGGRGAGGGGGGFYGHFRLKQVLHTKIILS
jgi:hypothetical protein